MKLFPPGNDYEDNYKLLVMLLVERLGGSVTISDHEVFALSKAAKVLYIEPSASEEVVTLEVVPDARPR